MLISCPECNHSVSNIAIACPSCGYPISSTIQYPQTRPKIRKRHKKLPNGYGSIKKLSGKRSRPYAAYPPTTEFHLNGSPVKVSAIGYFKDWYSAFNALQEYNKDPYDIDASRMTFAEIYELYYDSKYNKSKKQYSKSARSSTTAAFNNCKILHDIPFSKLKKAQLQKVVDDCNLKHASLELIVSLFKQMYKFALDNDYVNRDYSANISINIPDDDEKGEPFSIEELQILWSNSSDPIVQKVLILCYSGFRIKAYESIVVNMDEGYFFGGIKTAVGKDRYVPFAPPIESFINSETFVNFSAVKYRRSFFDTLSNLGILTTASGKKHTPHDCRHTFSWLCDRFRVDDFSKHLLMGHSLGNDVERSVYGHRTLDELRAEIGKLGRI